MKNHVVLRGKKITDLTSLNVRKKLKMCVLFIFWPDFSKDEKSDLAPQLLQGRTLRTVFISYK